MTSYLPKDFIETNEGLIFAVVSPNQENGKVLAFLRYNNQGKLSSNQANQYLQTYHPEYLYRSLKLEANLHAVPFGRIQYHHQPRTRLKEIIQRESSDPLETKIKSLLHKLKLDNNELDNIGVTGSILVSKQNNNSDIDLVIYEKHLYIKIREQIQKLLTQNKLNNLSEKDWQEAYSRRGCTISLSTYKMHELRKFNKAIIDGTKFDISLVTNTQTESNQIWHKSLSATITATVIDESQALSFPAIYGIEHNEIKQVYSFTHTYVDQVRLGETLEAKGLIEVDAENNRRLIVGSTREAEGEYIICLNLLEQYL